MSVLLAERTRAASLGTSAQRQLAAGWPQVAEVLYGDAVRALVRSRDLTPAQAAAAHQVIARGWTGSTYDLLHHVTSDDLDPAARALDDARAWAATAPVREEKDVRDLHLAAWSHAILALRAGGHLTDAQQGAALRTVWAGWDGTIDELLETTREGDQ